MVASRATVICSNCGTENETGRKFCAECGSRLTAVCPACGTANSATAKFCGECATRLTALVAGVSTTSSATAPPTPVAERRLVTVLFADLAGFTPFAEERDAEEVRDTLSRYFDTSRAVIERYGGTVEKFIGDAVMALWGAPVAREDAALAGLEGRPDQALAAYRSVIASRREAGVDFIAAWMALDLLIVVGPQVDDARRLAQEAQLLFERLRAQAFLQRLDEALAVAPEASRAGATAGTEVATRAS